MESFARRLIRWQCVHGRHDLPWQGQNAYRVWLSEIMLQQTQVASVIPYYQRFIDAFPDIAALAAASEEQVLAHWSGLGYYARARNLHRAARIVMESHGGRFPHCYEDIVELPGIGRSTAAAICALAWHQRRAILDGNVRRVLARWCGIAGWPGERKVEDALWRQAERLLPLQDIAAYTQALMDIGATLCTRGRPKCGACPVSTDCVALQSDRITELPSLRPKKTVPERHAVFLLLMHGNDILLERRPGKGIWGGLWCLPWFGDETAAQVWFERSGMQAGEGERLELFTHTFTHFRLHIVPLKITLARKPSKLPAGMLWLDAEEMLRAAIPVPVRRLLKGMSYSTFR